MNKNWNMQEFLEQYYWADDSVILACSGGPDSMYLAHQILETRFAKNLVICYFNHKTRPETEEEEIYLEKFAKEKWCRFESAECDFEKIQKLYPSRSFEELAREKRYQFLDAIMNIYNSKYVLTGHHLDDRIETMIFNMLRGTKLTGLINMQNPIPSSHLKSTLASPTDDCNSVLPPSPLRRGAGGQVSQEERKWGILRPLLQIEKKGILDYLEKNKIKYFIDETNSDSKYTRNKLRNEVLPLFEEIHPEHKKQLSKLMDYFSELKDNLDSQVESFFSLSSEEKDGMRSFKINDFETLSPLLQKEIIKNIFYKTNDNSTLWLSEWNIAEVLKFISWPNWGTVKEIKNMKLVKKSGIISFSVQKK